MDSIMRLLGRDRRPQGTRRRIPARVPAGPRPTEPEAPPVGGGHGDHWGCVLRSSDNDTLLGLLGRVTGDVQNPIVFGTAHGEAGVVACSPGEKLRACVLLVNDKLVTAYPEVLDGPLWPVKIEEAVAWSNGVEGQIKGECHGEKVSFFDTRFYANRRKYIPGETYNFHMGALAYRLEPATDVEVETDLGAKVSLKGASAFMPASMGNPGADIDDYWFHSPLEAGGNEAQIAGRTLTRYPVTVALPEDFEMRVSLYAAPHVLGAGTESLAPGDDIEGFLWLQGYLEEHA